jgi:Tol biopolymer transport system component
MRLTRFVLTASTLALVTGCASLQGGKVVEYRLDLTGAAQGLSRVTNDLVDEYAPTLSPDAAVLLFDVKTSDESTIAGVDPTSGARRTVYTSNSSLANEATWDPTGRFFVYSSNSTGTWSLVRTISNSPNAAVSIIVNGQGAPFVSDPSISPDGKKIVFGTFIRGVWHIGMTNLDGSGLMTLLGDGHDPVFSPDGKRIAFVRMVAGRAHVFSLDPETGTKVVQVTSGESDNVEPSWSPDGQFILFASNRAATKPSKGYVAQERAERRGRFNLFALRPDGTTLVQLTDGEANSGAPTWGKDGWIYFSSNQAGNFDIWRLKPTGELVTPGTPTQAAK